MVRPGADCIACYAPASMEAPDAELVRTIAGWASSAQAAELARARAAEAELCRRFAPRIRLYGLRHLRDEDRAHELVQAVLLAVLEAVRAGRVDDPERIDRFMLGTCRHVAQRMRALEGRSVGEEPLAALVAPAASTERVDTAALVRCMAALDERGRQVVMLSFNDEKPTDQIAARLGISVGNVRVLRHRAIAALRRCLDSPEKDADA